MPLRLSTADLARLAAILRPATGAMLTRAEALGYTKHESGSAFYRWCARWGVKSITNGRFSRPQLDRALQRESRKARFRKAA